MECTKLWVQQRVKEGLLGVGTIPGKVNTADLGTKILDALEVKRCAELIHLRGFRNKIAEVDLV